MYPILCSIHRLWALSLLAACLGFAACAHEEPILVEGAKYFEGKIPVDFSGSWARDYSRGDNVGQVWRDAYFEMARLRGRRGPAGKMPSDQDMSMLRPLARLAEMITRPDELTISQSEYEILIARRDDFALMCAFYAGVAQPTDSIFAREICGWEDDQLVSLTEFQDGLTVVHRFDISEDNKQLRVITTVSSDTAALPFTVEHYYWRFNKVAGKYECIETLSMKRVCSTGRLTP